jgi:two-component system, chemotaxis family, CheB/CheR fusion protein
MEQITAARKNCPVQVFATDIDEEALNFARQGIYPESIAVDVAPERLSKYFIKNDRGYQVIEPVRKSVVFATQNLITDPPFSKMDVISCRNLLIYLDVDTQTKLIQLFNFALNPGGYLFLGKSEGIGSQNDLFDIVSKKTRLFRRLTPAHPVSLDTPILPGRKRVLPHVVPTARKPPVTAFSDIIRQTILNHFSAAVILADRKGQILQFHGQTGKYLNMPTGEPSLNLLEMTKEGIATRLRSALHKSSQDDRTVMLDRVPITRDKGSPFVRVTITPTSRHGEAGPLFAVIFEDIPRPSTPVSEHTQSGESEAAVKQLEDELTVTRQELQATIGEFQASNEELRVSNEEVVSTNEELQSTVEELETSKEELQSVNEELMTVNSQLQDKVQKLDVANSDMANFLESTQIATLFLDVNLRIKLFTPATTRVLKLIPSDKGRPINDLSINFTDFDLLSVARTVATRRNVVEREVQHDDGSRYLVRVMPYHTERNKIDGVIVTFSDITRLRQAEKQIRRLATIVMDSNDAVLLFDLDGKILTWNRGAQDMYGWSEGDALRMNVRDMTPPDRIAETTDLFHRLAAGKTVSSYETQRITKDGRILDIWLTATSLLDNAGKTVEVFSTTERDITEHKKAEQQVLVLNEQLKHQISELEAVNKELYAFTYTVSHDLRAPLRAIAGFSKIINEDYPDKLDAQGRDYLTRIKKGTDRMNQLIDDLLRLSRISLQDLDRMDYDLSKLVGSVVKSFQDTDSGRNVEVVVQEGLRAFIDPNLMKIALTNLFNNAWKFTSKTENAHIEFGATEKDAKTVYFVKDNGVGFDPVYAEKMFLPFQRLHPEKEFEGTGIGLAIVDRVIRRHKGSVWAEGEVGEGATIYFMLG